MTFFCACLTYVFWYVTNNGVDVCECGHPKSYHIAEKTTCIGDVEIR